ncbi:MAG: hypothetical protein K9W44_04015 [Candidatus Lokiarchaeota archaeon]|nr:hypothetical protein [Candidatus Harpocratesius repetitus]
MKKQKRLPKFLIQLIKEPYHIQKCRIWLLFTRVSETHLILVFVIIKISIADEAYQADGKQIHDLKVSILLLMNINTPISLYI